jgi:hypothetical protein
MKKTISFLVTFACLFVLFVGTALASSTPTAMSYFSNSKYNKTYTGDDGLQHTMKVLWVGETWNKVGTVIYFIDYADSYDKDGDHYTSENADTVYFDNARPEYPDSSQYRVYSVKWYPDGHYTVLYDYRPSSTPEPTNTPVPTAKPTATPTVKASPKPTSSKPSTKPATATPAATPEQTPSTTPTVIPTTTPTAV